MRARWVLALVAIALPACDGCARRPPPAPAVAATSAPATAPPAPVVASATPPPTTPAREVTWHYADTPAGPIDVVVSIPAHARGSKLPVLIALHGRGEAFKGPVRGARGWVEDYWMPQAIERLEHPPLVRKDFLDMVEDARLGKINASLAAQPYRGLVVASPYTPDILAGDRPLTAAVPYGKFLVETLLPRLYRDTPAVGTPVSTAIDGVSLGGRASLLVGFAHPRAFGVVASMQAAFDSADAPALARMAADARRDNPKLVIRLLTSDGDFFLNANRNISRALTVAGVEHRFIEVPGSHSYEFNRGPGVIEMLLFHDRVLRGEASL